MNLRVEFVGQGLRLGRVFILVLWQRVGNTVAAARRRTGSQAAFRAPLQTPLAP